MNDADWVIIGRFGRPHGVKGLVRVNSFTEPRDNIISYMPWYASIHHQWQMLKLQKVETTHNGVLAKIEGYEDREQVAQLTNAEIAVKRAQLPELKPGEYYWHQLMGMQVTNQAGASLGKVTDILPTGANDVLVVVGEKKYLIPYVLDVFVLSVDVGQQTITVDWDVDF